VSRIHLRRAHELTREAARRKVERIAEALAKRFDAACEWKGDVLSISHPSVNGEIVVGPDEVIVEAKLGFVLAMFRDRIDEEIVRILDKEFPAPK
jgi:putative polyhydroxyalkanoate system protein